MASNILIVILSTMISLLLLYLAETGRFLCNTQALASLLALGYLFIDRNIFARTIIITVFVIIYNSFLKSFFQIAFPTSSTLYEWSFPSGHTHVAFACYGWLCLEYRNRYSIGLFILLMGLITYSILYFKYHHIIDIIATLIFGYITVKTYHFLLKIPFIQEFQPRLAWLLCIVASTLLYFIPNATSLPYLWSALGLFLGTSIGWTLSTKWLPSTHIIFSISRPYYMLGHVSTLVIFLLLSQMNNYVSIDTPHGAILLTSLFALWITYLAQRWIMHHVMPIQKLSPPANE